ncbi:MAG: endolytic transglycosylase MltG [Lachnospiraceae bacterium]|nr:endolytic transglycosylase MltG [Lachnospiraceae bacterium]
MSIRKAIFNIIDVAFKVVLVVIAVMFIIKTMSFAYDLGLQIFDQRPVAPMDGSTVIVTVSGAESTADLAKQLEEKGLIGDARIFRIQERLSVYHDMIGAGTYELSPSMTPDEMIAIMAAPTVEAKKNMKEAEKQFEAAVNAEQEQAAESDDAAGMGPSEEEINPETAVGDQTDGQQPEGEPAAEETPQAGAAE